MELNNELDILKSLFAGNDISAFKKQVNKLKESFTSEAEINQINEYVDAMVKEEMDERKKSFNEIKLHAELILNKDIIPFSYIAKHYFKKSKAWFYQRLNGNSVNGKPVGFTQEEILTLNSALQDISKKIGSISIV